MQSEDEFSGLDEAARDELELRAAVGEFNGEKGAEHFVSRGEEYEKMKDGSIPSEFGAKMKELERLIAREKRFGVAQTEKDGKEEGEVTNAKKGRPVTRYFMVCGVCGERGHVEENCPKVKLRTAECYRCRGMGHVGKDCTRKAIDREKPFERRWTCRNCGGIGHLADNCASEAGLNDSVELVEVPAKRPKRDEGERFVDKDALDAVIELDDDDDEIEEGEVPKSKLFCPNCGLPGHLLEMCTSPQLEDFDFDYRPTIDQRRITQHAQRTAKEDKIYGPRTPIVPTIFSSGLPPDVVHDINEIPRSPPPYRSYSGNSSRFGQRGHFGGQALGGGKAVPGEQHLRISSKRGRNEFDDDIDIKYSVGNSGRKAPKRRGPPSSPSPKHHSHHGKRRK